MLGCSIAFCAILVVAAALVTPVQYKGIAEKGAIYSEPHLKISAYIKDKQCDAYVSYPEVLPCQPTALRVEAIDSKPFPDVRIDQALRSVVVGRQGSCTGQAQVNILYACKPLDHGRRSNRVEVEDKSSDGVWVLSDEQNSLDEFMPLPSTPKPPLRH